MSRPISKHAPFEDHESCENEDASEEVAPDEDPYAIEHDGQEDYGDDDAEPELTDEQEAELYYAGEIDLDADTEDDEDDEDERKARNHYRDELAFADAMARRRALLNL